MYSVRRVWPLVLAGGLLAGCSDATVTGSGAAAPGTAGSATSSPSSPEGSANVGADLCRAVDPAVVRSVVGGAAGAVKAEADSWGWSCRWEGQYISVGPNGAVGQPVVLVMLYKDSLSITDGTAAPTPVTVAGRAGTLTQAPRRCDVRVQGTERAITISVSTPVDKQEPCARARATAERLVPAFVR